MGIYKVAVKVISWGEGAKISDLVNGSSSSDFF